LKLGIERLLSHPVPRFDESVGSWIERIAADNQIQFNTLYWHILSLAQELGFIQALNKLTDVSVNRIAHLTNEFQRDFWRAPQRCPIKGCDYGPHTPTEISTHLQTEHNLGRNLLRCPYCTHQILQMKRGKLVKHIKLVHEDEIKWWGKCPYCDYEPIRRVFLIHHLITDHGLKLPLNDCLYCDYLAKNEFDLKSHLWNAHGVKREHQCPQCEYQSQDYTIFISHLRGIHAHDRHILNENMCSYCEYKTQNKALFEHHLWIKHNIGEKWYICPDPTCSFKSKHQTSYSRHIRRTNHGVSIKKYKKYGIQRINNIYKCPKCSEMSSKRRNSVVRHLRSFHNVE